MLFGLSGEHLVFIGSAVAVVGIILYLSFRKERFDFEGTMMTRDADVTPGVPVDEYGLDPYSSLPQEIYDSQRQYNEDQDKLPKLGHATSDRDDKVFLIPQVGLRRGGTSMLAEDASLRSTSSDTAEQQYGYNVGGITW
jgi:hypothetical protein